MRTIYNLIAVIIFGCLIFVWNNIPVALFLLAIVVIFNESISSQNTKEMSEKLNVPLNAVGKRVAMVEDDLRTLTSKVIGPHRDNLED